MNQDDLKQKLSEWMDDESADFSQDGSLAHLLKDEESRKAFESYHAIRAVLNNESCDTWNAGFCEKVSAAIENEPTIFAPNNLSPVKKMFTGWAVAASVALAVVLGVQWYPAGIQQNEMVADESSLNTHETILAEYHVTDEEKAQLNRINTIFNQYSSQSNPSNTYVRLVSGESVKTYRMTPRQFRQVMAELERRQKESDNKATEKVVQP